ncbi:hypothetical protein IE4872_PC00134 (plasmid) [Rhizobium gallicum]|uniref:Uncharacterized protein n=1 Tax=Rhizobium gallicum TaxID=56730 RepID=A0A1L5NQI1_9HYPH|nr:hypothetical protein IE4872_PC00134 [Rhizobium gallicum]
MTGVINAELGRLSFRDQDHDDNRHGNVPSAIFAEGKGAVHATKWVVQRART